MYEQLLQANRDAMTLWRQSTETALAAGEVIARRGRMMAVAGADPRRADLGELGRMVPEKLAAIGMANLAIAEAWFAWSMGSAGSMASAWSRALDPFHARATANARRLRRRR